MAEDKQPGPGRGSEGARKIAQAHRGPHEHDREGGFAANPELAKEAGRKGGEAVKKKYGPSFYRQIGKKGGETVKQERGSEFYAEIGRRGGEMRSTRMKQRKAEEAKQQKGKK
ncbi:MAG: general stress protein B [Armatimonadetes bacterium]|nr:general stress protein B [Armatimonadota bacterium]